MIQAQATARYVRTSAQKAGLVLALIRGKDVNQALATGIPIITSDAVGAGLDYVRNGVNGVTVRAGDVDELHGALQTFARNPELVQKWGLKSREMSHALTPEAGAGKWVQVFDTMAAR